MIPAGIVLGIPWWLMALSIMMIDIETALFMGWNFDLALKIPVLGRMMESFISKADEFIRERPWLKKLYFTGIVVLVMVPVTGSGGIRGTIIGNLLGMENNRCSSGYRDRGIHRLFRHRPCHGIPAGIVPTKYPVG